MSEINEKNSSIKIGGKAFLLSAAIILALMIVSGVLTKALPAGIYDRVVSEGRTLVVNGSYREIVRPNYPFWRWFTAPVEILYIGPDNITPIVLAIFITIVGGSIAVLEFAGVMEALINFLVVRFAKRKYLLIMVMIFFFMALSSFVGIFEGMIPMIIFIIPIAISLGWDSLTGLGMSLLPLAFGFASAVTNPFSIAVAQKIADLPLFSGSLLRLVFFLLIFCLVSFFVIRHAKKVEKNPQRSLCYKEDEVLRQKLRAAENAAPAAQGGIKPGQWRALIWFVICIALAMLIVISTARMPVLSNLAFPLMAVFFLAGGIGGGLFAGLGAAELGRAFKKGTLNILPGILLVLMAYSVKHIITTGMIMDTILYRAAELIRQSPPMIAAFLVYATTLVMNFFIGSASAKAFLMMPLLTPLADLVGITRQTAVLAFDFGDGFSNMIFPTNALLLIALSFSVVSYTKWMRWTWKLQIAILIITSAFLAFAVKIKFGPF
ncbi:C4-dicarboxylate ABC transporter [Spirochaetia bacterium]|nr:C4-dicarboxylate ABC transporter [Spirochaetia bacterium]